MQFVEPFHTTEGSIQRTNGCRNFQIYDGLIIQTTGEENYTQLHGERRD